MMTILLLLGLAIAAGAYVYANHLVVCLLMRRVPPFARLARCRAKRMARIQTRSISITRIRVTIGIQLLATAVYAYVVLQPLTLIWLATLLFGFALLVIAVTLSLLKQLPVIHSLWEDVATKVAALAVPIFVLYVARGYAGVWVGDILGVSAANSSTALFAAATFLLCVVVASLLLIPTVLFEVAPMFPSVVPRKSEKRRGFLVLFWVSFLALIFAGSAITQLPSDRLGSRLIAAIIFEFDAAPAHFCDLHDDERRLADRDEPVIKALYLSSSQETALLLKRAPALFRPVVLRDLISTDIKTLLQPVRVVECLKKDIKLP